MHGEGSRFNALIHHTSNTAFLWPLLIVILSATRAGSAMKVFDMKLYP